ncbi:MAG: hypothetical protein J4400_02480 [Candidatus Aenigmarchaeota archaeon]|nr:hypothetical protein [Candidatus Aenigmarchaeota archaeon]
MNCIICGRKAFAIKLSNVEAAFCYAHSPGEMSQNGAKPYGVFDVHLPAPFASLQVIITRKNSSESRYVESVDKFILMEV